MAKRLVHPSASDDGRSRDDALKRAVLALHGQRPREAEHIAGEVLQVEPRHAQACHILGRALLMQGRAHEAIAPLEAAGRGRHDAEVDTDLAIALRLAGRYDDALRRLKLVVKRHPLHAAAYLEQGYLFVSMARYEEAIATLTRGVEVAPMMPRLFIELGYAYLHRRDCANAEIVFARALGISPESPDALFGMAKALQEVGNGASAVPYFRSYLRSRPNDVRALITFGHCLLEIGQLDEGYECFRRVARADPKHYGRALEALLASGHGRFWLKPSAAKAYLLGTPA
jgi:tetratricopeptide (TPR) repeat protein